MENCIFCKIIKGELPSTKVFETDTVLAFNSIAPVADNHILIIPKKHIATFLDLNEADKDCFMDMTQVAQKIILEKNVNGGYKLIFNGGKYQEINHIHWHLLGGNMNDNNDPLKRT